MHIRRAKIKKKVVIKPNVAEDAEKLNHFHIASGNVKRYSYSGKQFAASLKTKHVLAIQPRNYTQAFIPGKKI